MGGYINAYKTGKELLERIRSGRDREERAAKAQSAREDLEQGLVRRRQPQKQKETSVFDPKTFLTDYMKMAGEVPQTATTQPVQQEKSVKGPLGAAVKALAMVESTDNFEAIGPVVQKGMYKGQRAYGKYQVMEGNIGPWTKELTGRAYSKEEFLANKDNIQTRVVANKMRKSYEKYGTWEDAASVWFSGQPLSKAGKRSDGQTTVPEYVSKFQKHFEKFAENEDMSGTKQAPVSSAKPQKRGFMTKDNEV